MVTPLLSIVIPTRNRQYCAESAIKGILSIESNDFELIVQDNSDSEELRASVDTYKNDCRLRYYYSADTLPTVDNFSLAFRHAKGEYICAIGDDDFVNPEIVQACAWAKRNGLDAISDGRWGTKYFWPGFGSEKPQTGEGGKLQIQKFSGNIEMLDPEVELCRCVRSGGMSLQRLPRPYLGIVRRACLVESLNCIATSRVGTCPDMFYAVAVSAKIKRMCVLDYPLAIAGYSPASAGQLIVLHRHEGRLEDAPHLRARPDFEWPEVIPRFYSVNTFYAESALRGLQATGRRDLIERFNLPFLYVMCAILNPEYRREMFSSLRFAARTTNKTRLQFGVGFVAGLFDVLCLVTAKRVSRKSLRPGVTKIVAQIEGVNNSAEAMRVLTEHLKRTGRRYDENILHG